MLKKSPPFLPLCLPLTTSQKTTSKKCFQELERKDNREAFAFHVADLGFIFNTPYNLLSPTKSDLLLQSWEEGLCLEPDTPEARGPYGHPLPNVTPGPIYVAEVTD